MDPIDLVVTDENGNVIVDGKLTVDAGSNVTAIDGTVNGFSIDSVTTFGGADNEIQDNALRKGAEFYDIDERGLAFSSNGVQYNLQSPYLPRNGETDQEDVLTSDNGAAPKNVNTSIEQNFRLCFTMGTLIRTALGNVAVEHLVVGDLAVTASGAHRPIRWLGHRMVDCASHPKPSEVWPVRILANTFGAGVPERDLYLSLGHPVLVGADANIEGGVLVPIMCLINGTSVARVRVDTVTYWHVELDEHDILLAEGLPAESFLDFGCRAWFGADADAHVLANPDFIVPGLDARCRPVATDGPLVEAKRRDLSDHFAKRLIEQCAWPAVGNTRDHRDAEMFAT